MVKGRLLFITASASVLFFLLGCEAEGKQVESSEVDITTVTMDAPVIDADRYETDNEYKNIKVGVSQVGLEVEEVMSLQSNDKTVETSQSEEVEELEETVEEEVEIETTSSQEEKTTDTESIEENKPEETEAVDKTQDKKEVEEVAPPFNGQSNLAVSKQLLPLSNSAERTEDLTHIMIHFASNALHKPHDPYQINDIYNTFNDYGVSAHYVIDRNGEISLFVEEDRIAYHAGRGNLSAYPEYNDNLNPYSIGIELLAIGTREEMVPIITGEKFDQVDPSLIGYTDQQYTALNQLINDLNNRHPLISKNRQQIVGHDEYSSTGKTDPGSLFDWSRIGL